MQKTTLRSTCCALLLTAGLILLLGSVTVTGATETAPAPTVISLQNEPEGIVPRQTQTTRRNPIIFINNGTGPVTVKFITKVGIACAAPVNFYADLLGYYETGKIARKGTASICLIETGTYEFEVRRLAAKPTPDAPEVISRGKVVVK